SRISTASSSRSARSPVSTSISRRCRSAAARRPTGASRSSPKVPPASCRWPIRKAIGWTSPTSECHPDRAAENPPLPGEERMGATNRAGWICALAALFLASGAEARITRIVVAKTESPFFEGKSFGSVGQYERITGTAYGEVDPAAPLNALIQDIALAPRNARGMVEYSMDVSIVKPIDVKRGNGTLLYDVVNRGREQLPSFNLGGTATSPGDGFLESHGFTLVFSGWEGDLAGGIRITLPVAHNPDGYEITGRVRSEY